MAEEIVDALVLAARYDTQGLKAGEQAVLNSVDRVAQAMLKLESSGQISPFRDIGRDLLAANAAFRAGSLDLEGLNVALQQARIQMNQIRDAGIEPDARALGVLSTAIDRTAAALARMNTQGGGRRVVGGVDEQLGKVAKGADSAQAGLSRLRSGFAQLAVTALDTSSPVAQVTQGLLFMAGATSGTIIAIAATVLAYQQLTKSAREARAEQDALIKAQRQRLTSGGTDAESQSRATIAADQARILDLTREIDRWQKAIVEDAIRGVPTYLEERRLRQDIIEKRRLELALQADQAAAEQAHADAIGQVLRAQDEQRTSSLIAAPGLGTADIDVQQQIRAEMAKQLEIINAQGIALVDRNEAQKKFNDLQAALLQPAIAAPELGTATLGTFRQIEAAMRREQAIAEDESRSLGARNAAQVLYNQLREASLVPYRAAVAASLAEAVAVEATARAFADMLSSVDQATAALERQNAVARDNSTRFIEQQIGNQTGKFTPRFTIDFGFDQAQGQLDGIEKSFEKTLDAAGRSGKVFRQFRKEMEDTRTPAERLSDSIHDIVGGADQILGAANNIGLLGDEATRSLGSVLQLGDALAAVVANASFGNILGAVGAGLGAIGSLFGESAQQRQRDALLKENSDRLAELKLSLDASNQGGLGATRAARVLATQNFAQGPSPSTHFDVLPTADLDKALTETGLTLHQFDVLVKNMTGIEILDAQGHLVAAAFAQARDAVAAYTESITHFGTDIGAIDARISAEEALGITKRSDDPNVAKLEHIRDVELEGLHLSQAEEDRIRELDLNTAEGRAKFLAEQKSIFERAKKGELSPAELGAFATPGLPELTGDITDAAVGVNDFTDATKDATDALKQMTNLNLPQGFKLSELAFKTSPFGPSRGNDGATLPTLPTSPLLTPGAHRGTDINPTVSVASVTIHVNGADKPEETAAAIDKHLRRIGLNQSGDTLQMGLR